MILFLTTARDIAPFKQISKNDVGQEILALDPILRATLVFVGNLEAREIYGPGIV